MIGQNTLKQTFLRTLIVALVSSAILGIYTFLVGNFGETEAKILLTTLAISFFSVTSLACAAVLEKRRDSWLAISGLIVSVIGFLLFMPGIWAEWWEVEAYGKTSIILAILSFSFAQTCLLCLVPLRRSVRWIFHSTAATVFTLAAIGSCMMVFESNEEWLFRLLGVLGILDGCGTLVIPVLYKLGRKAQIETGDQKISRIELICPRCGHQDQYAIGVLNCARCSLEIKVDIYDKPTGKPVVS